MSNKTVFAQLIIDNLDGYVGKDGGSYNGSTPALVQQAVADAITEFVTTYVWCKSSYIGTMLTTPFPSDPVVVDDHQVTGQCPPASTPSDLSGWLSNISTNIINAFQVLPGNTSVTYAAPYFPFSGNIGISTDDLKSVHENNLDDPQLAVWEVIAQGIIDMLTGNVSGMTGVAMRPGQSTGSASVVMNYLMGGGSAGAADRGGYSDESYFNYDYLDWDQDTWDDYYWS